MARILLADDGIEFDGRTPDQRPLGGAESSVVALSEELAARGHEVQVRNKCARPLDHKGVQWRPIDSRGDDWPTGVDLYIANRGDKVLGLMPDARRTVFWIHNPARYLLKWRYLAKLWRVRPAIVFIGDYHATTYPKWAPDGGRVVIPYGLPDAFCAAAGPLPEPPPPRAVFTSNPLRSLDWLLEIWAARIQPRVPGAELHLFAGAATYGSVGARKAAAMEAVLDRARKLEDRGVRLQGPVPKARLIEELRGARAMLYRGDLDETFCLSVGEAQAMGVPVVVEDFGSVSERVIDGETGFVAPDDEAFADAARRLLSDDGLWRGQHLAALEKQRSWRWHQAAAAFERLIP